MRRGRRRLRPPNPYAAIPFATWEQLTEAVPDIVDVMVRYLEQIACILRPGSVHNTRGARAGVHIAPRCSVTMLFSACLSGK